MHQTKDGIKVTLVIHPNDIPAELLTDPVGSRYRVVMVLLDDDETPARRAATEGQHVAHRRSDQGNEAVMAAALLAKNPKFQSWCRHQGFVDYSTEDDAARAIRIQCMVRSRAEFATDPHALDRFNAMRLAYSRTVPENKE